MIVTKRAKIEGEWCKCGKCGHKLGRVTGTPTGLEIKCSSCKTINVVGHIDFECGRILITRRIADMVSGDDEVMADVCECLERHRKQDWGDLDDEDKAYNDCMLTDGGRILSAYKIHDSNKEEIEIWIITEADRSCTTILLPEEY